MNTETICTITFDDIKQDSHLIAYVDENIVVLDNQEAPLLTQQTDFKLDCFAIVFCTEGESSVHINHRAYLLKKNLCALLMPNTVIRPHSEASPCRVRVVVFSNTILKHFSFKIKETWDIAYYLYYHPIFPIRRNISYKLYLYKELALNSINTEHHPYHREARRHLFSAIFCEVMATLHQAIPIEENAFPTANDRSSSIFRRFMEKVAEDDGTHRSVSYYADLLCYSPKHLSTIIKKTSGKTPLSIINRHAMECIKYELKHSEKSIKEIADRFEFANPSFFGKFVKTHLGISPLQYRILKEEEESTGQD